MRYRVICPDGVDRSGGSEFDAYVPAYAWAHHGHSCPPEDAAKHVFTRVVPEHEDDNSTPSPHFVRPRR